MSSNRFSGVLAPVITPFQNDLAPDAERLLRHCKWLLSQGAGLAVFGTNSEANSLSLEEKIALLDALVAGGIPPERLMPGTGGCALPEVIRLTRHAVSLGCGGSLMLPPFYYKGVSDDGLFAFFSAVIEGIGDTALRLYLYHIPQVTQVPLSLALIERLLARYPDTIAGIKDSSGDWNTTLALNSQGWDDFRVFCGSESFLLRNMQAGGAGCISATANVNPAPIHALFAHYQDSDAEVRQAGLDQIRLIFQNYPMIPALKAATADCSNDPDWCRVRPPIAPLTPAQRDGLRTDLAAANFRMPGL